MKKLLVASLVLISSVVSANHYKVPSSNDASKLRLSSQDCMAINLYHESRSESDIANMMILSVVLNRVEDKRYPDTICEVVFGKHAFSWTNDKLSDKVKNEKQYHRLYKLVEDFLINKDLFISLSEGADHYHTVSIKPYWAKSDKLKYINTVDKHKFYKWRK